ncbi:MAG: hypothetical protein HY913_09680 [Desulfomonile tiedjei]|nr:hypothetical protein [Desulfomonile tiedjei]
MRRNPCTLLVCIAFSLLSLNALASQSDKSINVIISPSTVTAQGGIPAEYNGDGPVFTQASARRHPAARTYAPAPLSKPVVKCKPPACPVGVPCGPKPAPPCILPKRMMGQWEFGIQAFFATTGGTVQSPALVFGLPASEVDFDTDLGLPVHQILWEYKGKFQFRPSWAVFYSIMPIHLEANNIAPRTLYIGQQTIIQGAPIKTTWDFVYQRVGLVYQPYFGCNTNVSISASWVFNDQQFKLGNGICAGSCATVNRTRNMVMTGIGIEKCIRTLCNGATLSCDSKVDIGFLDGVFALDVEPGMRFSIPLNCGRWGYIRGGYRYLNFKEDRDDLRLDTVMQGGYAEMGLIF